MLGKIISSRRLGAFAGISLIGFGAVALEARSGAPPLEPVTMTEEKAIANGPDYELETVRDFSTLFCNPHYECVFSSKKHATDPVLVEVFGGIYFPASSLGHKEGHPTYEALDWGLAAPSQFFPDHGKLAAFLGAVQPGPAEDHYRPQLLEALRSMALKKDPDKAYGDFVAAAEQRNYLEAMAEAAAVRIGRPLVFPGTGVSVELVFAHVRPEGRTYFQLFHDEQTTDSGKLHLTYYNSLKEREEVLVLDQEPYYCRKLADLLEAYLHSSQAVELDEAVRSSVRGALATARALQD